MKEIKLEKKEIGNNEYQGMRDALNKFCEENFGLLYKGAIQLKKNISADCYAARRVQINRTRLNESCSHVLKYAAGHKYDAEWEIGADEIRQTVSDIQALLDAAAENTVAEFRLEIVRN